MEENMNEEIKSLAGAAPEELAQAIADILDNKKAKDVKKKAEDAKVAVRNIRRDGNDALKKLGKTSEVSEDEVKQLEDQLQKLTDKYVKEIDVLMEAKTKEIMTV